MKENMGQIIKRLRKERNLTQEELAEQLNISAVAVSKWENNASMPDISQIVPLSNLFGVPTDVLFGVYGTEHEEAIKARLEEIYQIYDGCMDGEEGPTALIILDKYRDAMRLYPNNATILTEAIAFGKMVISCNESQLKKLIGQKGLDSLADEIIHWAELVIKYSTSIDNVFSAKKGLIDIHAHRKNWDAAYALAKTFPFDTTAIQGEVLADLYFQSGRMEEEKHSRCGLVVKFLINLSQQVSMLGNLYMREGQYDDALTCYTFLRDAMNTLHHDEIYKPPFHDYYYPIYRFSAECLVKLGREDEAIQLLEEGVAFILAQAKNYNKKHEYDNPLLRGVYFSYGYGDDAEYRDLAGKLKRFVECDTFKALEEVPQYKALVEKVKHIK